MRIVVIDSDCFVLGSILKLCETDFPNAYMLGVRNGWFAIDRCQQIKPDLVILEVDLRDCDGLGLVDSIRLASPTVKVLGFSAVCDRYTAHRVKRAGLDGYLCKRAVGPDQLAEVMRTIMRGERYFDAFITSAQEKSRADAADFTKVLSDRELEFLGAIGAGLSNKDLATQFHVSESTANNHRGSIMAKLSIRRSLDLMRFAAENGVTRFSSDFVGHKFRPAPPCRE